jgi:uncharacterized membrane protein
MLPAARWLPVLVAAAGAGSGVLGVPALLVLRVREIVVVQGIQQEIITGLAAVAVRVRKVQTELQRHLAKAEMELHLLFQAHQ